MNIIQQHERARFLLDRVGSTRFESEDIDNALNGEIELIVREKYDQNRLQNRSDAFERTQRVRDELKSLLKYADKLNGLYLYPTVDQTTCIVQFTDFLGSVDPTITDYRYLITMQLKDSDGTIYPVFPMQSNMKTTFKRNPFRRTRHEPISKFYYVEGNIGYSKWIVHMSFPTGVSIDDLILEYLGDPTIVNYGVEYDSGKTFANGAKLIAVEQTVYAGATYVIGENITIVNPNYSITSGLVVANFIETELPVSLHEEICRRAAASLLFSANESEKAKTILSQIIST